MMMIHMWSVLVAAVADHLGHYCCFQMNATTFQSLNEKRAGLKSSIVYLLHVVASKPVDVKMLAVQLILIGLVHLDVDFDYVDVEHCFDETVAGS